MTVPGFDLRQLAIPAYGPTLLFGAAEGALLPVIPATATARGASLAMAAFAAMLLGLGSLVSNLPAATLTERFGERRALQGAGVVSILACALCLVPTLWALMVGVSVLGMASSVYMLARQKYLTESVPPSHRARALSLLGGVGRIGMFLGPVVGAGLITAFGTLSAYCLAIGALVGATWCASLMGDLESPSAASSEPTPTRVIAKRYATVFRTVGLGILLVSAVRASRQVVIPLWGSHIGMSEATISLVYGIAGGIDMLVFYPAGKVMDVKGRAWVAVPSMLIMSAALVVLPLTHVEWSVLIASCALGFGNGIGSGMVMTLGADFSPDVGRAAFLGVWRQLSDTGSTVGPLLLSGTTMLAGLPAAIEVNAAIGLGAAGILAVWPTRLRRQGWGVGAVPVSATPSVSAVDAAAADSDLPNR